jgi:hypothetical protein
MRAPNACMEDQSRIMEVGIHLSLPTTILEMDGWIPIIPRSAILAYRLVGNNKSPQSIVPKHHWNSQGTASRSRNALMDGAIPSIPSSGLLVPRKDIGLMVTIENTPWNPHLSMDTKGLNLIKALCHGG